MRDAARVVDEKWATARAENLAGYADVTGSLEQTEEALQGVARANASAVIERDEEVETFGETFRAFRTETRARLAFCEKAAAWPENAKRDFLADVREDKRVVAVLSLERIDEAHRAARPARRTVRREAGTSSVKFTKPATVWMPPRWISPTLPSLPCTVQRQRDGSATVRSVLS